MCKFALLEAKSTIFNLDIGVTKSSINSNVSTAVESAILGVLLHLLEFTFQIILYELTVSTAKLSEDSIAPHAIYLKRDQYPETGALTGTVTPLRFSDHMSWNMWGTTEINMTAFWFPAGSMGLSLEEN